MNESVQETHSTITSNRNKKANKLAKTHQISLEKGKIEKP